MLGMLLNSVMAEQEGVNLDRPCQVAHNSTIGRQGLELLKIQGTQMVLDQQPIKTFPVVVAVVIMVVG